MKKPYGLLCLIIGLVSSTFLNAQTTLRIYDNALFYDGYADTTTFGVSAPPGVVRLKTSLFTKKISPDELAQIGTSLTMKVWVKAGCDNYDRIGNVNLALVPKGNDRYSTSDTTIKRIEIARFITPFMDKNKSPNTVPYEYEINNVASIMRDKQINDHYDIWLELEIFGVPYSAQTQIFGCSGKTYVFYGTVDLVSNESALIEDNNVIIPLGQKLKFNNYQSGATDVIGQTVKTLDFRLDTTSYHTHIYLITSNHGAGNGGEEYIRRMHFVYLDGEKVYEYKPGYDSCEPYRPFNTQGNGIYGLTPRTDQEWQSFSNWCPGAIIPIRVINIGTLAPGDHTFKIAVPDAQFVGADGNFPLSVYLQGKTENVVGLEEIKDMNNETILFPNPAENEINIRSDKKIRAVTIVNALGQEVLMTHHKTIDISLLPSGVYYVKVQFDNEGVATKSFVK